MSFTRSEKSEILNKQNGGELPKFTTVLLYYSFAPCKLLAQHAHTRNTARTSDHVFDD